MHVVAQEACTQLVTYRISKFSGIILTQGTVHALIQCSIHSRSRDITTPHTCILESGITCNPHPWFSGLPDTLYIVHTHVPHWAMYQSASPGHAGLGHPKAYINLDKPEINFCGYCGRFVSKQHKSHFPDEQFCRVIKTEMVFKDKMKYNSVIIYTTGKVVHFTTCTFAHLSPRYMLVWRYIVAIARRDKYMLVGLWCLGIRRS